MSVSDTELAALIADLTSPRCTITDLLATQCAHCRPTPPAPKRDSARLGPWFAATYPGNCASCGARFDIFDQIRADGDGGWLADCCGHLDDDQAIEVAKQNLALTGLLAEEPTPPAYVPAAACSCPGDETGRGHVYGCKHWVRQPIPAAGPPASTVALMRDVLADLDASRPRSMQTALGPSELGTPCQRQLAMKLAGIPRQLPDSRPPWAPMQGTAIHGLMEEALHAHNAKLGYPRWVVEERLHMDDEISGSGDAFDVDNCMVVDWKYVGVTTLREVKRKTVPNELLVKPEYRVQPHLYGYGHERAGRTVHWVRLVFLARSHNYDDSAEWTERYDPDIAIKALDRYYATQDLIANLRVADQPDLWDLVPAAPGKPCDWCPFRRLGGPADGTGCPGNTQSKIDKQTAGLIA